jgi:molybdopterin converting factor small subunit
MKITLLFFGIAHDLSGSRQLSVELPEHTDTAELRRLLAERFKGIDDGLGYAIAVNEVHHPNAYTLNEGDVVAILPPVSGG